ncbi:MAG: ATP-binding protein [Pseudomonadota bacterium]
MWTRRSVEFVVTVVSVTMALAVLAILLVISTAPTPEQFRQLDANIEYLQKAGAAVSGGISMSTSVQQPMTDTAELEQSLFEGALALEAQLTAIYQPVTFLDELRWPLMAWLNIIDSEAGQANDPAKVLASHVALQDGFNRVGEQLGEFTANQTQLYDMQAAFEDGAKQLVGTLREAGQQRLADGIYIQTEEIKTGLSGVTQNLDPVLATIDQLETYEAQAQDSQRTRLRYLINTSYTMVSLQRAMTQAVNIIDQPGLMANLEELSALATQDQLYVLGAVNEARILLNIYTVLMLAVLAAFGLRLRASHAALNRSHDDLELRVEERTQDLAQAHDNLKESQVQLVQAEKMSSLGQLVAGVMHEINTPLLYVLNNTTTTADSVEEIATLVEATLPILRADSADAGKDALKQLLAQKAAFDPEELAENIEEIRGLATDSVEGLNQISELVQSLKDFSRLDRMADDRFDVREGVEKTLTITRNLLKSGVTVEKDFQDVPEIYCSPSRLNQVFINLVTNAVQAMDGQGTLKIRTSCSRSSRGESVEVVFEDTGCGIPEEHLQQVMDPFFTTKPVGQGTGLGLSIVRQIIDQHNGQILVDSKVGHGTRITLSFPVDNTPETLKPISDDEPDAEEAA